MWVAGETVWSIHPYVSVLEMIVSAHKTLFTHPHFTLVTDAGDSLDVARIVTSVCDCVCVRVRALKGKRIELSTATLVDTYSGLLTALPSWRCGTIRRGGGAKK